MKTVLWVLAIVLVASMSFYAGPVLAQHGHGYGHDNDCTGNGDCAKDYIEIAPRGQNAEIPRGQFMMIAKYFNELVSNPIVPGSWNVIAYTLFDGMDDPALNDEVSDFFVVDMRTPAQYCAGHLTEAVNIPVTEMGKPEMLAELPFDKPILLICNGGFNASLAQGVLRILGYDAWTLRGGMLAISSVTQFPLASPTIKIPIYGITNQTLYGFNTATLVTCQ